MILLIRKKTLRLMGFLLCTLAAFSLLREAPPPGEGLPASAPEPSLPEVIIDPGHGGEDGGAVSSGGIAESGLNLSVSLNLEEILAFAGVSAQLTRREDVMLSEAGTLRQRKASDLRSRVALVENTPGAVLISIHQNALPASPETHGAQAFYSPAPAAAALAEEMQRQLNAAVNTHRAKEARKIPGSIYLLNHVTAPAVLVECGFLSNEAETALLQTPEHQKKLAVAIAAGYLRWRAGEEGA